jgi:hypothetical protein
MEKTTLPVVLGTPITTEVIAENFSDYKETAMKYEKYALALEIASPEQLAVATNNEAQINSALKNIEEIRKRIKDPFFRSAKAIDSYAGLIADPLENVKSMINKKITAYKQLQEAQARLKAEEERKALQLIADEKTAEINRLARVQNMVKAMIYGGEYQNASGVQVRSEGVKSPKECDLLLKLIKDKFPAPSSMKYMNKEAEIIFTNLLSWTADQRILIESTGTAVAMENALRIADQQSNDIISSAVADQINAQAKEEKQIDKGIAEAKKGIRRTVGFEVVDKSLVPADYKVIHDPLINAYISDNKEGIMILIREGKEREIIPGIKFVVNDVNISR